MATRTVVTDSESETAGIGRELAAELAPGSVVLLFGDLGAGKTAFVRGLAEGLGVEPSDVSSPTFTLIQQYRGGRMKLLHVDLFRLHDAREIEELGLEDLGRDAVVAIEWAERLPRPVLGALEVRIQYGDDDIRQIEITDSPDHRPANSPIHSDR
jgi:tRNA threonylcarbamoyladenosine biosynthesis protein TsaE